MARHRIQLGRQGHAKGHCHDCAQVRVEVTLDAPTKKDAVKALQALAEGVDHLDYLRVQTSVPGVEVRLYLDPKLIESRTVKVLSVHTSGEHKLPETLAS